MSRYFFHVVNGDFIPDRTGLECRSAAEVKEKAVEIAGEMLRDQGLKIWGTRRFDMFVCDERSKTLLKLSFLAEDLTGELSVDDSLKD